MQSGEKHFTDKTVEEASQPLHEAAKRHQKVCKVLSTLLLTLLLFSKSI